jgi:hypothetical protein
MCENLDWNVGRALKHLETLGVAENTIVVWFHDNGPNGIRWNGGMKGKKGSTDEGGVRSPLYIRWPKTIKAGVAVDRISSARDLLPTLCDLVGISNKPKKPLDGLSLKPLILDPKYKWPERILINHWRNRISARSQQFRLDHQGKLYDMANDPGQKTPVNKKHPEQLAELQTAADKHRKNFMPTYMKDDRPFVIAHPDFRITQLPARDAKAHGGIKRSSRHPNCSYFYHWTKTTDYITFDAEVAASGTFKAVLYYTAKQAGAKCELNFNDAKLKFKITEAHNVPQHGAEHDHYPRTESYVKDFKALPIGTINLKKGIGKLTLKATDIPGEEAMEFRLLTLERIQ